ncbi:MAG: hypothetical protein AABN33_18460 [Acidobacteriota bacterium]
MAQAVKIILRADYDGKFEPLNPWTVGYHLYECERAIWCDDGLTLVDFRELIEPERGPKCGACDHEWNLWEKLLKLGKAKQDGEGDDHPATFYGDMAYRGLSLENKVLTFGYPKVEDLDGFDFDLAQLAYTARKQFEVYLAIERQKKAERESQ